MDVPDLDLVTAGVVGPLGAVTDAAALTSVLGDRGVDSVQLFVTIVRVLDSHRIQT